MRPQDDQSPSSPPPAQLPRPRMMVNDIRPTLSRDVTAPPNRDSIQQSQPVVPSTTNTSRTVHPNDHLLEPGEPQDVINPQSTPPSKRRLSKLKIVLWSVVAIIVAGIIAAVGAIFWYQQQLQPVSGNSKNHVRFSVEEGTAPSAIGDALKRNGLIRSKTAFSIYTKVSNTENKLKAGVYSLTPSASTQEIVDHLVSGKQDTFSITFLPGDTLANNRKKIISAGYTEAEVDAALDKSYDRPLFVGKPASADLEGYIYGETYVFDSTASVESILNRTFDEYEKVIVSNNLSDGFKKQGFNLYQGITLASIIQREVSGAEDERQVARVFLNRMKAGMSLGSDVTYQYAAKKLGVAPTPTLDSPYNTRIVKGLPPGPISTPGVGALKAVANPGTNDFLFFLSGDNDVTYFAKTDAEHQMNITNHCQKKCLIN